MATSTIDANPGDNSILEDDNDPDLSLETGDDPVSDFILHQMIKLLRLKRSLGVWIVRVFGSLESIIVGETWRHFYCICCPQ